MRFLPKLTVALAPMVVASLMGAVSTASMAQSEVPAEQANALKQKLAQRMQGFPVIDGLRTTPIPGLLEIRAGQNVFYVDAKGEHLIEGHILETRTQRDLTQERLDDINKVDFDNLPLRDAVVWKNGNGKRR
ncbi:MAG TPA: disulfide isomerase DsbC N-terminal domain-containing protein, partial [Aquabacterium sp.]|nr:disulfide isomerase DsbC N-terminal domain-containing protein [Aquabacterium sp.]